MALISSSLHVWHSRAREYSCVRIISCQMTRTRRTLALWLGEPAIGLLTIERLHNVTRQFFVSPPPRIFRPFFPPAELSFLSTRAYSSFFPPFSPLLGRSWFYSSPFHFLFTARDLRVGWRLSSPSMLTTKSGWKKKISSTNTWNVLVLRILETRKYERKLRRLLL